MCHARRAWRHQAVDRVVLKILRRTIAAMQYGAASAIFLKSGGGRG
jgi:hypothetical protein